MPPRYAAAVNCPSCGTRFQTPVEQILDVRVDPSAKNRVLSGTVNVAVCPSCGTGGALNLPFIYHDPDKEVALLYLPVDAGPNEVERQRAAGRLTRQLMDAMPPEERKGYLLQPETFISLESLAKRLLEIEGISEEEMARSGRQREFLGELLQAEESDWPAMVAENASLVDEGMFAFLEYVMQQFASPDREPGADTEKLDALHEYLVTETEMGRLLSSRSEVVRQFVEDPTRDSLLNALIASPDAETVDVLVQTGISVMDYGFFQKLNQRIEEADSPEAKASLVQLRRSILDIRDEMMKQSEDALRERAALLAKLVDSEDPRRMASSHLSELDDLFFTVLGAEIQESQQHGEAGVTKRLQEVAQAVNQVMESTMPPEIALTRRLMAAPTDEQLDEQLRSVKELLTPAFLQFLEALRGSLEEQGQNESAERVAKIRARAEQIAPAAAGQVPAAGAVTGERSPAPRRDSEERTPSGLIIAKH